METCEIRFRSVRIRDRRAGDTWIQTYLGALAQNGQIAGGTPVAAVHGGYRAFVSAAAPDALDTRHSSKFVRRAVAELVSAGFEPPTYRIVGTEPDARPPCACRQRPYLFLYTDFLTNDSPVRCGRCSDPVPLYRLPATTAEGTFLNVLRWQSAYQSMDSLHIGSGAGEQYAQRQLSDVRSVLSRDGRAVAAALERKTRRKVYYYLMKPGGRSLSHEMRRRCPSCGGTWLLKEPLHRIFDFRCDRCRLFSNIAFEVRAARTPPTAQARMTAP